MNGEFQGQGGAETTNVDAAETAQTPDLSGEIESLRTEFSSKLDQLAGFLSQRSEPQQKPVDYNELVKTDLGAAIKLATKESAAIEAMQIKAELTRKQFDERLEKEFPTLQSDKAFKDATLGKMKELVANGEYSSSSPSLAYRAAQLAALSYKPKAAPKQAPTGMSGEAPRTGAPSTSPAKTDPQFETWMKVFDIKDKDGMRARWDAHQKAKGAKQ